MEFKFTKFEVESKLNRILDYGDIIEIAARLDGLDHNAQLKELGDIPRQCESLVAAIIGERDQIEVQI